MKSFLFRLCAFFAFLFCATTVRASTNCAYPQGFLTGDNIVWGDAQKDWKAQETLTYQVTCYTTDANGNTVSYFSGPNSVTAHGAYSVNRNGHPPVSCGPTFWTKIVTSTAMVNSYFENFGEDGEIVSGLLSDSCSLYTGPLYENDTVCVPKACPTSSTSPPDCGCCSGPVGAKLLETPSKKDVKLGKKPQTSCYYDCACCQPACSLQSPIILDVAGAGFFLTDAANGVLFDIRGTGKPIQIAWTAPGAQNAFLCLPDANGVCGNGKNLFGNFTPQPPSSTPNGYAALAVYDQSANGGNGDGIIDAHDAIYSKLRLWIDANHDGISQPSELFTLSALGVNSISLDYKWDGRTDQYGNILRYRAQVNPGGAPGVGRNAYDVFFQTIPSAANTITAQSCPQRPSILQGKDRQQGKLK